MLKRFHAAPARPGPSFIELAPELRNMIYDLILVRQEPINMSLDPTKYSLGVDTRAPTCWGRNNCFAIFSTCRQIYDEASSYFFEKNTFVIRRVGGYRDLHIPRAPGMPFHLLRHVVLEYNRALGPSQWELSHLWNHFVADATAIVGRFTGLQSLEMRLEEQPISSGKYPCDGSWVPLADVLNDTTLNEEEKTKCLVRILKTLHTLIGARMPACVRFAYYRAHPEWWYTQYGRSGGRDTVDMMRLNVAIEKIGWSKRRN